MMETLTADVYDETLKLINEVMTCCVYVCRLGDVEILLYCGKYLQLNIEFYN